MIFLPTLDNAALRHRIFREKRLILFCFSFNLSNSIHEEMISGSYDITDNLDIFFLTS